MLNFVANKTIEKKKMDNQPNKYVAVAYKLYTTDNGETQLIEEATDDKPFQFITGFGITLDAFEKAVIDVAKDGEFDFTLTPDEAYGEHMEERVLELDKNIFCIDGRFDTNNIFEGAIIPLQNEDGNRFMAQVLQIGDDKVKVDLNHPLAGSALNFKGHIVENREASKEEIQNFINQMNHQGCGGGCDNCSGGCGEDGCKDGNCDEGHCKGCH
jgi:FKBP-type peptidyl-prolyl cis-trans isomerase SlyD